MLGMDAPPGWVDVGLVFGRWIAPPWAAVGRG
jgi:hypothetical protein